MHGLVSFPQQQCSNTLDREYAEMTFACPERMDRYQATTGGIGVAFCSSRAQLSNVQKDRL
jgi:hypothetical protein